MNKDFEKIFTLLPAKKADLILLILTSQNIETQVEKEAASFNILVNSCDREKAVLVVEAYYKENKFFGLKQQLQEFPISSFNSYPAFAIMGLLFVIHFFCLYHHVHEDMILKYGASALFILQGETYRAITALFLHSDGRHLLGN
ncbi:MAG: hypothetical protein KKE61_23170, partial [Proteobacteria bacterium]|nr:hypothetical protein [Pseudomonadota bacterium]